MVVSQTSTGRGNLVRPTHILADCNTMQQIIV